MPKVNRDSLASGGNLVFQITAQKLLIKKYYATIKYLPEAQNILEGERSSAEAPEGQTSPLYK